MLLPDDLRVLTDADLTRAWRMLRGDLRFADLALWILVVGADGRPGPLLGLAGLPDGPYEITADDLRELVGDLVRQQPGGSAAVLYARPGGGPWHIGDRSWVRFLQGLRLGAGGPTWPVHRARDAVLDRCPAG